MRAGECVRSSREIDALPGVERPLAVAGGTMLALLGSYIRHVVGADSGSLQPMQTFPWQQAREFLASNGFAARDAATIYWWNHVMLYGSDLGRIVVTNRSAAEALFSDLCRVTSGAGHVDLAAESFICLALTGRRRLPPGVFLDLVESRLATTGRVRGGGMEREVAESTEEQFWVSYHRTLLTATALAMAAQPLKRD